MWYGTSVASPVVAGVVALMMGANPNLSPAEIESLLKANSDDLGAVGRDTTYGYGRVNAYRAVAAAAAEVASVPTTDTTKPTVTITSPANGTTVSGITSVSMTASDNAGIARVDLYIDGQLYASDVTAPFTVGWDTTRMAGASHMLVAKVYDTGGNENLSGAVTVNVSNGSVDTTPPTTQITSMWTQAHRLKVGVAAGDNVAVVKVELYVDGKLEATSSGPTTFTVNLKRLGPGTHGVKSKAYDAAGNVGTSSGEPTFVK
jgi:hypothetical protein